mgnify:CR=1 FL=1|jgi:hypothetical protein
MKTETLRIFKKIFRPKLYDKEMREKLLGLFDELFDDNDDTNNRIEVSNDYYVDDLLDKINNYGVKSLTKEELYFLNNQ